MTSNRINSGGWLAIGLGIIAGVLNVINVIIHYRRDGNIDWVFLVIGLAIPVFIYASVSQRQRDNAKPTDDSQL